MKSFYLTITMVLLSSPAIFAQIGPIIWEDDFNSINQSVWNEIQGDGCDIGLCGWGNAELQSYETDNLTIETIPGEPGNSALVLEARRENSGNRAYTSGKVDSENKLSVQYGLIEIRMRVPDLNTGLWPAAWLLGTANISWPGKGEIDMMEMGHAAAEKERLGHPGVNSNNYVGANAIFAAEDGSVASIAYDVNYNQPYISSTSMADRFVTYRLYWEPTQMRYTVIDNGTEYDLYTNPLPLDPEGITGVFNKPFYFLLNLAVGGNFTDAATNGQVNAPLPAKMYVDYVRVYEYNGHGSVETDYGALAQESGPFGVFTENTPVSNELTFGSDAEIYIWGGTMTTGTEAPAEGSEVISWETTTNSWFGGGIVSLFGRDMSNYIEDGMLKFRIKAPANLAFRIGLTDNFTNESWVTFPANQNQFGLVRNGGWSQVEIPLTEFAGLLAFQNMNYMFAISSVDGSFPAAGTSFAIDDIYWDDGTVATVGVTGVTLTPASVSLETGETQVLTTDVAPANAANPTVTYASSNTSVATVNASGQVSAVAAGSAVITVTTDDGGYTDVTSVTVTAPPVSGTNLALAGTASQSSTDYGGVASRAIDNNTNGAWSNGSVTHTNNESGAWWQVDMGENKTIDDIVIFNRTDNCCSNRLSNYTVEVVNDLGVVTYSRTFTSAPAPSVTMDAGGVQGQVVRVLLNVTNPLSLAEVQVFGSAGIPSTGGETNLALTGTASQSSTAHNGIAGRANDDNTNGNYNNGSVTHTATENNPWWEVELAAVSTINDITIWNRTNCCGTRLSQFTVSILDASRTTVFTRSYTTAPSPSRDISVGGVSGKYVRVQLDNRNPLSLAEVQVFGVVSGTTSSQRIEAEDYDAMNGILTQPTSDVDGNENVGWIDPNDWMEYNVSIPSAGTYTFDFRVASDPGSASVRLATNGTSLGTFSIGATGGWQVWNNVYFTTTLPAGNQTIRLTSLANSWNINWLEITAGSSSGLRAPDSQANAAASIAQIADSGATASELKLTLSPVPVRDQLRVSIAEVGEFTASLNVIDITGRGILLEQRMLGKSATVEVGNLPPGVYLLNVLDEDGRVLATKKFVK